MATHNDIGLSQPAASTITHRLRAFQHNINSTVVLQEAMTIAGAESSLEVARVLAGTPASTDYGIVVREAAHSTGPFAISSVAGPVTIRSSAANALVTVYQSSAADFNVTVAGYVAPSTTVTVARSVGNSSAADYMPVRLVDSSGTGFLNPGNEYTAGSTYSSHAGPVLSYDNSSNNTYRTAGVATPFPVQLRTGTLTLASTTAVITSTHSTAVYALVSSAAGTRHKVYAYFIGSTQTTPSTLVFMSSAGSDLWAVNFGSGSSGITGANLAVTPPAFLFATDAANALNVRIEGGSSGASTVVARVSFSYVSEA